MPADDDMRERLERVERKVDELLTKADWPALVTKGDLDALATKDEVQAVERALADQFRPAERTHVWRQGSPRLYERAD